MSHKHGAYLGGIRSVEDLRQRSHVNDDTGCWHYKLQTDENGVPSVHFVDHEGRRVRTRGRRAALILATGKDIPNGHVAFAKTHCHAEDCVNPEHSRHSNRANHGQYLAFSGKSKTPAKAAAARKTAREKLAKIDMQKAREIRASTDSNRAIAEREGISESVVSSIRRNASWKESTTNSSVFSWRPAA